MKKSILFRILIAVPFVLAACNKSEDVELDFNITFPDDWTHFVFSDEGRVLDAARNAKNEADSLRESLVIFRTKFPSSTLGLYYATLRPQIMQSLAYDSLTYESDTLINEINFKKMQSHEWLLIINSLSQDTSYVGAVTERYFTYRNDYGYNLTFVTIDTAYPVARGIFDDIISTFEFKN